MIKVKLADGLDFSFFFFLSLIAFNFIAIWEGVKMDIVVIFVLL